MTIQYCSDLHLEYVHNEQYILENPIEPAGDMLVLAGDITSLNYYNVRAFDKSFFRALSKQFERVLWIPGNHEFYRSYDAQMLDKPVQIEVQKNVHLLNNVALEIRGVRFLLATLWSHIDEANEWTIGRGMSDFDLIRYSGRLLTPAIYVKRLHQPALTFLRTELAKPFDGPTVVVTHHMPSLQCVHPKHKNSTLQQGFANDLDAFILETQPDVWLYGHSHANRPPIQIGKTQLLTNMLGYCAYGEEGDFQNPAVIVQ